MSLERAGASELFYRHRHLISGRTLEIGAGRNPYRWLSDDVVTVDIAPRGPVDAIADAHHLPLASGRFQTAIASQVLEHLHSPWVAVAELARVLKPGGLALVSVPFLYGIHSAPFDFYRYTEFGLRRLFEEHFTVEVLHPYGGRVAAALDVLSAPKPSSTLPRKALRRARRRFLPGDKLRRPLVRGRLLLHSRSAPEFPLGYFLVARRGAAAR